MTSRINLRTTRWLLAAGLASGVAAAHGATGYTITENQANVVAYGMTTSEVQQILGRPANVVMYRSAPGPTWTYRVIGTVFAATELDIDFGADGTVKSVGERVKGIN